MSENDNEHLSQHCYKWSRLDASSEASLLLCSMVRPPVAVSTRRVNVAVLSQGYCHISHRLQGNHTLGVVFQSMRSELEVITDD